MNTALPIPGIVVLAAVLVAAATDLWTWKVHNLLTIPLLLSGLIYHGVVAGAGGLGSSVLGVLFAFGVLILPYLAGGMGAGDVKLLAGVGAWVGLPDTLHVFVISSLAAGLYSLVLVVARGRLRETWANFQLIWLRVGAIKRNLQCDDSVETKVAEPDCRSRLVPFALMVAIGVVVTILWYGG